MTEDEVIETIRKVSKRYASKFKFGYYDVDDIEQEAFMIGMEALSRYDENRPLENFLAVHIKNRLKNFKRDNYYRNDIAEVAENAGEIRRVRRNQTRKNLMDPITIESVKPEGEESMQYDDERLSSVEQNELLLIVDTHLEVEYRKDYLKIKSGVYVSKSRREEVFDRISDILGEINLEEG